MRREDVPQSLADRPAPQYEPTPAVNGPPIKARRIAIVSTAGLMHRGDHAFDLGSSDYRILDTDKDSDILMTHISTNFDRSGFVQDLNVVLPLDRLREKAETGEIGSVARYHYSFMGATSPEQMEATARHLAKTLRGDEVDGLILVPV